MKVRRCDWANGDPLLAAYHDAEWGVPVHDDRQWYEKIVLDGAQAGLSWLTILKKRDNFRTAFHGFDAARIARYGARDVARLMADARIVRNRLKISAAVVNARATVALREQEGLEALVLSFAPDPAPAYDDTSEMPTTSPESKALSKELKRRGFAFVGPTTMYALMEAIGVFDPHLIGCHRRASRK